MKLSNLKGWLLNGLHTPAGRRFALITVIALLFVLSLLVRKSLIKFQDPDYAIFSSWYDFIKVHGIHSFKYGYSDGFSNYNPPYSYFLYLVAVLPISKIVAIKGLLVIFDLCLAGAIYLLVKLLRPGSYLPYIAALAVMFLPTVLVNGVMWGQFDQLYVAAMLMSLYYGLQNKSKSTWAWFGVAISIKLQAIFFLPVLGILIFKRIRWHDAYWAVISFLILTLPPLLVGRSIASLLSIYPDQIKLFSGNLVLNAPTMYQWFPNSTFNYINHTGTGLAIAAALFVLLVALIYNRFTSEDIVLAATLLVYLVPFLLPAMHERYFFPAGIFSLALALAYPRLKYALVAVAMQVITLFSYMPFLFSHAPPIPFPALSIFVLTIICLLAGQYMSFAGLESVPLFKSRPKN